MSKLTTLGHLGRFLWSRKRHWMIPLVAVLALLGVLLVLAETTAAAPFVYTLF